MKLVAGTRGSRLAKLQTDSTLKLLKQSFPRLEVEKRVIKTTGDKIGDAPLTKIGGKGIFVKEIDEAVRLGRVSFAVHSMKDVPIELLAELHIAAVPEREEDGDAFISRLYSSPAELPQRATVGTSSLRRIAEVKSFRADLEIRDLRGNVDTRLRKLGEGSYDAIIMAVAGLKRLGYEGEITRRLSRSRFPPSVGQGAIALVSRKESDVNHYLKALDSEDAHARVLAERELLKEMGGGCQVPLGASTTLKHNHLRIEASVFSPDGSVRIDAGAYGRPSEASAIGKWAAEKLKRKGAGEIIRKVFKKSYSGEG